MPRTAQQVINYVNARRRLEDEIDLFVKTVRANNFKIRSVAWNYRRLFRSNGTKRHMCVTLFGESSIKAREPEPGLSLPEPMPDRKRKRVGPRPERH